MLEGLGYPRPEYAHVPFVAEPGSKNKLSKRKIAQYLKYPDFKKIYDHALNVDLPVYAMEIAAILRRNLDQLSDLAGVPREPRGKTEIEQWMYASANDMLSRQKFGLAATEPGNTATEVLVQRLKAAVDEIYWKNPELLKHLEHAKQIEKKVGLSRPSESFNPVVIDFYQEVGYLPAAILNYLVLLGWATEDNREDFTLAQMVEEFSLERVVKAPASLDVKKLLAFQARYMQALPVAEKVAMAMPFLVRAGLVADAEAARPFVTRVVEAAGPRLTVAGDILDYDYLFLPAEQIGFDPAAATKSLTAAFKGSTPPALAEMLTSLREVVAGAEPFDAATLQARTEELAKSAGAKAGPLSQVLRVATTGREVGFSAYDTLAVLGRDRCLARINQALQKLS
jgi:glutamyl-tRNA synthetase